MGDISAEPSMEDILSSIKRIIAEEGDAAPGRPRRMSRPGGARAEPVNFEREEVLELRDAMPEAREEAPIAPSAAPVPEPAPTPAPVASAPAPVSMPAPAVAAAAPSLESLVSARAEEAMRGPLDSLSRLIVKPEVTGSDTLEGMVREMLRPMLREWLDAHLPAMVEAMVAREINRITSQAR